MCDVDRGDVVSEETKTPSGSERKALWGATVEELVKDILKYEQFRVHGLRDGQLESFVKSDDVLDVVLPFVGELHESIKSHSLDLGLTSPSNVQTGTMQPTDASSAMAAVAKPKVQPTPTPFVPPTIAEPAQMEQPSEAPIPVATQAGEAATAQQAPSQPSPSESQTEAGTEIRAELSHDHAPQSAPPAPGIGGDMVTATVTPAVADVTAVTDATTAPAAAATPVAVVMPVATAAASTRAMPVTPAAPTGRETPGPTFQAHFALPNCKVGTEYSAKICGLDTGGRTLEVLDITFPEHFGLVFSPETQMVTGVPKLAGDHPLPLQWCYPGGSRRMTGACRLTSNPDPRSLWKVVEPDTSLPFRKDHLVHRLIEGDRSMLAAASRRGRSHEHGGTFRDDDFFVSADCDSGWSVLIVADGAGSAEYSREGSRIAVETAGKYVVDSLHGEFGEKLTAQINGWDADTAGVQQALGSDFHYFFHRMASLSVQAIEQEANAREKAVRSYSTTLLAAAIKRDGEHTFLATFWMGDGAIAAYGPTGTVKLMGMPDGGEFAGQTRFLDRTALADQAFGKRVRIGRLRDLSSVILLTDGVSDPYFETDNGLAESARWDALWNEIAPLLKTEDPSKALLDWLHFFRQGHHDDRTIAMLW